MSAIHHILVMRLSSFGDVAMTVPVIKQFKNQYPEVKITVLTRKGFKDLFDGADVQVLGIDMAQYPGLKGLFKLYKELKSHGYDAVADCHNVLRTQILSLLLGLSMPVKRIDKGRSEKKKLTQKTHKELKPLKSTFERYAQVFQDSGFDFQSNTQPRLALPKTIQTVGIAPFAMYAEKAYPLHLMKSVVENLVNQGKTVYLLGTPQELASIQDWQNPNVKTFQTKGLKDELNQIAQLDVVISMDSANMHLASLVGVPVVSVWGATHPYAGFLGFGQSMDNAIQNPNLSCRPCSVFGNKPCFKNDVECLTSIAPQTIVNHLVGMASKISE